MSGNRLIQVNAGIVGPKEPRFRTVEPKKAGDYPSVARSCLEVAKYYANPMLFGPPLCDELVALVQHMLTEEEAALVQHIKLPSGKTASAIAAAADQPLEKVQLILDRLANGKGILLSFGAGEKKRYVLPPLVPGVFELVLMRTSLDSLTEWHRRFAELFAELYETGFFAEYAEHATPSVRFLPVGQTIEAHPMALPSDQLEQVLDPYKTFAVGLCQCRMAEDIVHRGCGRPLENCVAFGDLASPFIRNGRMRQIEKRDVLRIKAEAESAGLATWVFDTAVGQVAGGASCSCCGCCCRALRTISEFNMPGMIAPPHFTPRFDHRRCNHCAQCAWACPVGALIVDTKDKSHRYLEERCIGCGLCAVACNKKHAIQMEPVARYREPTRNLLSTLLQVGPNYLRNAWSVWRKHKSK